MNVVPGLRLFVGGDNLRIRGEFGRTHAMIPDRKQVLSIMADLLIDWLAQNRLIVSNGAIYDPV